MRDLGVRQQYSAAAMISATPALLSAPSSVIPDAVTMSWPMHSARVRRVRHAQHHVGIIRQHDVAPVVAAWTIGFTPAPLISGDVSTCAMNPITGTPGLRVVAGIVAVT